MVNIKIILDTRKAKKDNSYPVCFRIYHRGKSTIRSVKIYIKEDQWDDQKKVVLKNHPNSVTLNKRLLKEFADLQSELLLADDDKVSQFFKPAPVIKLQKEVAKQTIQSFVNELIRELRLDGKVGNSWVYESALNALKKFHPADLSFEEIDFQFLDKYNKHLLRSGVKHNTAFFYLRTLRAFYNKAIKHKIVDRSLYPFHDITLKAEKTKKRAIDKLLIKEIVDLALPEQSTIWHVRNWFMLSFYLMGISIVDLALLTPSNIKNGRIYYKRQKTGKLYDIKLLPQALAIIDLYKKQPYGYILPIINRKTKNDEERLRLVKDRTRLANKYLKRMGDLIETDQTITTYTSRHSWATICKKLGFSIEIIAEALGHEYGNKTTAVYLDSFDQDVIDNANEVVANSIDK
ncbi:Site-specific recombinase XerD [Pedobacter westerhofensis]|uniref:Site-specific recombinase XerD n=1 Tax=Pedobacter westerhofensis TaxID=425512 RepID=A0A521F780_9SPHI|nr:site-specific integrase [Pedobacter westerhofensis]SMO92068.1 Site-specific recombinase XerD [Pedobacter westerhofensis]